MFWHPFPSSEEKKAQTRLLLVIFSSSVAALFLMLDRCNQEKHRATSFVPHFGMLVQHFLRRLRFGELRNGETSVN